MKDIKTEITMALISFANELEAIPLVSHFVQEDDGRASCTYEVDQFARTRVLGEAVENVLSAVEGVSVTPTKEN